MNNCIYFSVNFPPEAGVIVLNDGVRCAGTGTPGNTQQVSLLMSLQVCQL